MRVASRGIRVTADGARIRAHAGAGGTGTRGQDGPRGRVPMGRMARPDEIARAVRFLASAQTGYITGSVLTVDGGWMSFNQPGDAHPPVDETPRAELFRPAERTDARTVVVTGGVNGIGAAVVRRFGTPTQS
nr:SDR family oxidoreductase [Mesorhizobium loti]